MIGYKNMEDYIDDISKYSLADEGDFGKNWEIPYDILEAIEDIERTLARGYLWLTI